MFKVRFTVSARDDLEKALKKYPDKRKKVKKTVDILKAHGPSYPGLRTHTFQGRKQDNGETIYISYVENNTPQAWRVHWSYWGSDTIIVLYIGPHT